MICLNSWCNRLLVTNELENMVAFGPDNTGWHTALSLNATHNIDCLKFVSVTVNVKWWNIYLTTAIVRIQPFVTWNLYVLQPSMLKKRSLKLGCWCSIGLAVQATFSCYLDYVLRLVWFDENGWFLLQKNLPKPQRKLKTAVKFYKMSHFFKVTWRLDGQTTIKQDFKCFTHTGDLTTVRAVLCDRALYFCLSVI